MHGLDPDSLLTIGALLGAVLLGLALFGAWLGTLPQPGQEDEELKAALRMPPGKREPALVRWLLHIGPRRRPPESPRGDSTGAPPSGR